MLKWTLKTELASTLNETLSFNTIKFTIQTTHPYKPFTAIPLSRSESATTTLSTPLTKHKLPQSKQIKIKTLNT